MARQRMTYQELETGLRQGRRLTQEEWANPDEIKDCDKLIAEGFATATPWEYDGNFQCERRFIQGIAQ